MPDGASAIRRIVRVSGRVQGVGFRWATQSRARELGVLGTVRNLLDGTVEADVEGDPRAVEEMLAWLAHGPSTARVTGTDVREAEPRGAREFEVR